MPQAGANGVILEYESFGADDAPPFLLVSGLGSQMLRWDEAFCEQLAAEGFRVIRFDNRDVGLSTKFDDRCPDPWALFERRAAGEGVEPPYTLAAMAADAAGLLDALRLRTAHVAGISLGGMVCQLLAVNHPWKVRSMTSIASTTGDPIPRADDATNALFEAPLAEDRDAAIEQQVAVARLLAGPAFEFDEERARRLATRAYDRSRDDLGRMRQLLAVVTDGSRSERLRSVTAPALVIHGDADPLINVEGGRLTAQAIPGARLEIIEGMGHELPPGEWPRIIGAMAAHARAADEARARGERGER